MLEFMKIHGEVVLTIVGIILSLLVSIITFWIKKWIKELETKVEKNRTQISIVETDSQKGNIEIKNNYISRFENLERINNITEKNILSAISKLTTKVEVFNTRLEAVTKMIDRQSQFCSSVQQSKINKQEIIS